MRKSAFFFRIGEFSLINDAVSHGLRAQFEELDWHTVDVEKDIVPASPLLQARATAESILRYGRAIAANRQPPRDFFPRLPSVLDAIRKWVRSHVDPTRTAFIFQTQSLFNARHPDLPHFLYTDHTYLANRRYAEPKPLLPVAEGWRQMERDLYARADCNFVSSGFAAESLRGDYDIAEDRVEVVFSGTNVRGGEPAERSGKVILFVGVDWERKGGPELVTAFRSVRASLPEAELWVVGCQPAVSEPGVRIFGRVAPAAVADCYAKADIFCLPSRMDPSASVLAEAAAYELPIVATRVGGNSERVEDGVTGFLCEPPELSERLVRLLQSPELRRRMGTAGRRVVSERFTWEAVCARMANRMRKDL
ncbi:MAG TPA: glycosyltransferase family 4 protein, partial [Chthoniobacterales bacterium]|nr:glycosyltransferase family 4 protein [Chthoniobacterales bacterium]